MLWAAHRQKAGVSGGQLQSTRGGQIKSSTISNDCAHTRATHSLFDCPEPRAGIMRRYINQE
jgi:hypothetical protein